MCGVTEPRVRRLREAIEMAKQEAERSVPRGHPRHPGSHGAAVIWQSYLSMGTAATPRLLVGDGMRFVAREGARGDER